MYLQEWIDMGIKNGIVEIPVFECKTFEEVYKIWFCMKCRTIKPQSCDRIEVTYNKYYLESAFSKRNVSDINEDSVIDFLSQLVISHGDITLREFGRIYQIVNNVMVYAKDLKLGGARLIDWDVVKRYSPQNQMYHADRTETIINKKDIETLFEKVIVEKVYYLKQSACLCILLNFYLGLRIGELASLTWQDIDWEKRVVRINKTETKSYHRDENGTRLGRMSYQVSHSTKTVNGIREIPLIDDSMFLISLLKAHHEKMHYTSPFLAYDGCDTILVRSLDRTLRRLCRLCVVPYFNSHKMRKTFATLLHCNGTPTRFISDVLGHSEMSTTEHTYILSCLNNHEELSSYMNQSLKFSISERS